MTKTDLFRVVIKIFGIYCLINALLQLIPNISLSDGFYSITLMISMIYLAITGIIVYLLLFQTDRIIKILRLEKGFDSDKINIAELTPNGLFKFGVIIVGLLLIANNLAEFLNFCYLAFKEQVSADGLDSIAGSMLQQQMDYNWWIITGLNVLIGIIILTNYERISNLFVNREKNVG